MSLVRMSLAGTSLALVALAHILRRNGGEVDTRCATHESSAILHSCVSRIGFKRKIEPSDNRLLPSQTQRASHRGGRAGCATAFIS
eukprot:6185464-Pleurochrysis_carterae.AAC.2